MECRRWCSEIESCGPIEANLVPMEQRCHDCPYFEQEEKEGCYMDAYGQCVGCGKHGLLDTYANEHGSWDLCEECLKKADFTYDTGGICPKCR